MASGGSDGLYKFTRSKSSSAIRDPPSSRVVDNATSNSRRKTRTLPALPDEELLQRTTPLSLGESSLHSLNSSLDSGVDSVEMIVTEFSSRLLSSARELENTAKMLQRELELAKEETKRLENHRKKQDKEINSAVEKLRDIRLRYNEIPPKETLNKIGEVEKRLNESLDPPRARSASAGKKKKASPHPLGFEGDVDTDTTESLSPTQTHFTRPQQVNTDVDSTHEEMLPNTPFRQ